MTCLLADMVLFSFSVIEAMSNYYFKSYIYRDPLVNFFFNFDSVMQTKLTYFFEIMVHNK